MKAWLTAHGRMDWPATVQVLDSLACAWADLDGWHVASSPPPDRPIASHLWAWSEGRWARVRFDLDDVIVGVLAVAPPDATAESLDGKAMSEEVEVRVAPAVPWSPNDGRLPASARGSMVDSLTVLEVMGPAPLSFWHLGNYTPG